MIPEFVLDEKFITTVNEKHVYSYLENPDDPTPDDLVKILKDCHQSVSYSQRDHDEFSRLRFELEARGFIKVERGWWNGDYVLIPFKLNGVLFEVGEKFYSSAAMLHHLQYKRSKNSCTNS